MAEKHRKSERFMNWLGIVYPESVREDWLEILRQTHVEFVVSPLHDKDLNEVDEEHKKAHYHILILFPSVKRFEQVNEIFQSLTPDGVNSPIPIKCNSVKGSIRYFVHKDNPEKHQYNWNDIQCFNGADLQSLCLPSANEHLELQKAIIEFIDDNGIIEFSDMVDISIKSGNNDWLQVLLNKSSISINMYIKSKRHKGINNETKNI